MQTLIALRAQRYGDRRLKQGDTFDAQDAHARLLILALAAQPAESAATDVADAERPRRRSKRAQNAAED
jgi:hypothetical protein